MSHYHSYKDSMKILSIMMYLIDPLSLYLLSSVCVILRRIFCSLLLISELRTFKLPSGQSSSSQLVEHKDWTFWQDYTMGSKFRAKLSSHNTIW